MLNNLNKFWIPKLNNYEVKKNINKILKSSHFNEGVLTNEVEKEICKSIKVRNCVWHSHYQLFFE